MVVSIVSLWLPILLSAVLVFVASSIIHMFLGYHKNDFGPVPQEDAVLDALAPFAIPPGDYVMPNMSGMDDLKNPEFLAKVERGPVAFMTVVSPSYVTSMGAQLTQWFVYLLVVGVVVAYLAGRMLDPGADYLSVFRLTGTVAFACYAMAMPQRSIWYRQNWTATAKSMFDGLIYALLAAGVFASMWPA